jgi:predicted ATPase/DNA-binding CsgD family transcriptional regulator
MLRDSSDANHPYTPRMQQGEPATEAPDRVRPRRGRTIVPAQTTPLVGREVELASLERLAVRADVRLLTLTGSGGIGKTRVALRLASDLSHEFAGHVHVVHLVALRDPDLVLPTIARVLGVPDGRPTALLDDVLTALGGEPALLVLDNVEHLLPAAPVVAALLAGAPLLRVLATSRAPLRLRGEHEFTIPPLATPPADTSPSAAELGRFPAAALFLQRLSAVDPSFVLTDEASRWVADICRRLEGVPLALELAAARSRVFTLEELSERLERRLDLLGGGPRDLAEHQRTLRDTVAWSYDLLEPGERWLFRRLGVFEGGVTFGDAEVLCRTVGAPHALPAVEALVLHSLLHRPQSGPRLRMLETVREFALERLRDHGEEEAAHADLVAVALAYLQRLQGVPSAEGARWREIDSALPTLRAALHWTISTGDAERSHALGAGMLGLWEHRRLLQEGRGWLDCILAMERSASIDRARADLLHEAALLATRHSAWDDATARGTASLAAYRALGDRHGEVEALTTLALVAVMCDEKERAVALHDELLPLAEALGDANAVARATHNLGLLYRFDDPATARDMGERSLALYTSAGNERGTAQAHNLLGWANLGLGALEAARDHFERSLRGAWRLELTWVVAYVIQGLSDVLARQGRARRAATLLASSDALLKQVGARARQVRLEAHARELAARLSAIVGGDAFVESWRLGATLTPDALIDALQQEAAAPPIPHRDAAVAATKLTPRELDVLAALTTGASDKAIARTFGVTPATVSRHVANILAKTGHRNRTAAALWAVEQLPSLRSGRSGAAGTSW